MRPLDPASYSGERRAPAVRCETCGDFTREGKRFCTQHVMQHPYVQRLAASVADYLRARTGETVHPELVDEAISILVERGAATTELLLRDLRVTRANVTNFQKFCGDFERALAARPGVIAEPTKRGRTIFQLTRPGARDA